LRPIVPPWARSSLWSGHLFEEAPMNDSMKSHDASRWFISEPDSVDAAIPDGLGGRAMNCSPQVQVTSRRRDLPTSVRR